MSNSHYFHLVEESPWPILSAVFSFSLTMGLTKWFHMNCLDLMVLGLISLIITAFLWWRDISRESSFQGNHTKIVEMGLRWGMILFITSEVFFFLSFFWAFFHSSLAPNIELGSQWPPKGINVFNPIEVPMLNTIILISSGISVTWCHKAIEINNHSQSVTGLLISIILGLYFTALQGMEYFEASFSMADSVYGSTFFIGTGFHGLHVIVGTLFLIMCLLRLSGGMFSVSHHMGLIAAIWYWHFVDVVWLFLYCSFYVWGSWGV